MYVCMSIWAKIQPKNPCSWKFYEVSERDTRSLLCNLAARESENGKTGKLEILNEILGFDSYFLGINFADFDKGIMALNIFDT